MIEYVNGDATSPQSDNKKIIAHIVNTEGKWGSGFVISLSNKWKEPEAQYRKWHKEKGDDLILGSVQFVKVADDITVANMVGQEGVGMKRGKAPIRYEALRECLGKVYEFAVVSNAEIHSCRFGATRSGGDWAVIETIINEELVSKGVRVVIYDLV